jgi:hypothetical protein
MSYHLAGYYIIVSSILVNTRREIPYFFSKIADVKKRPAGAVPPV